MKYNIDDVFFVSVYVIKSYDIVSDTEIKGTASFVKETVVYKNNLIPNRYIDLYTKDKYGVMGEDIPSVGDLQINKDTLEPITNYINIDKINIKKSKLLKKVKGVKK